MPIVLKPGGTFLPRKYSPTYEQVTIGGTDITADIIGQVTYSRPTIRGGIGTASLILSNADRKYLTSFSEGDELKIYWDYTDGTTQKWEGEINVPRVGNQEGKWVIVISAKATPLLVDKKISASGADESAYDAIKNIIDNYFSGTFTYTNMSASMTALVTYQHQEALVRTVIADILQQAGYDGYIDFDNDINTFVDTGVENKTEVITCPGNYRGMTPYGRDSNKEKNRVKVKCAIVEEQQIIGFDEDTTIQGTSHIKDEILTRNDITTLAAAQAYATSKLNELKETDPETSVTSWGLDNLNPGDKIPIRIPDAGMNDFFYIKKFAVKLSPIEGISTTVDVANIVPNEYTETLEIKKKVEASVTIDNSNDMDKTLILETFDNQDNILSLSDSKLEEGDLILSSGVSEGTMISNSFDNGYAITSFEIRAFTNEDCGACEYYASNDEGVTWVQVGALSTLTTISGSGSRIALKVIIKASTGHTNPRIHSISLMVKR